VGLRDKRGAVSDIVTFPVHIEMAEPPPPRANAGVPVRALLRKEPYELVVTVRDSVGGGVFIRRLPIDPKAAMKSPALVADL
jgi:hypothetical protein